MQYRDVYLLIGSLIGILINSAILYLCILKYGKFKNRFFLWFAIAASIPILLNIESLVVSLPRIGIIYRGSRPLVLFRYYANPIVFIAPIVLLLIALLVYKDKAPVSD